MGRRRGWQDKRRYEVLSARHKGLDSQLRHLVRHRFGVCEAESVSVVDACADFLRASQLGDRGPLDVCLDVPQGRGLRLKVSPNRASGRPVVLSPVAEDDGLLLLELGTRAMQSARAVRMVEQADRAGCTLPLSLLTSLVHLTTRTLAARLVPLWEERLCLPVVGIPASGSGPLTRLALVLRGHLQGTGIDGLRGRLLLSPAAHGRLLRTAVQLCRGYVAGRDIPELVAAYACSPAEVDSTIEVLRCASRSGSAGQRLDALLEADVEPFVLSEPSGSRSPETLRSQLQAHLVRRHLFSPAKAELLVVAVQETARQHQGEDRTGGDIVFLAVSEDEPAGKALSDCELVATTLSFSCPDLDVVPRGTVTDLKVRKAVRLAVDARRQGGLLSLADLAFLLGMGVTSLQKAIARAGAFVPTRGTILDIGRGVSHKVAIVELYVQGYTEPQIVARTHHTYDSVARYLRDFRRVMLLVDQGLPELHIRKVLRMSLLLVREYVALYRQLDVAEHAFKLNLMRRAAQCEEKKRRRHR